MSTLTFDETAYLAHYGILRKSGRYPWGSGETQSARNQTFLDTVADERKQGLSEAEIARGHGMTTTQLRALKSIAKNQQRQEKISTAQKLHDKGYSNVAIGQRMGIPESSVRVLLAPGAKERTDILQSTATMLKEQVAEKKYIDIGTGVENHLGLPRNKLDTAIAMLQEEGYIKQYVKVPQLGNPGKFTSVKVLYAPGTPYSEFYANRDHIQQITSHTEDGGRTFLGIHPPMSISSKRVGVRYAEQGGTEADGVIYVRPGVKDVSIGKARYAQVRVMVDETHYLKGMALYKDDMPNGVDLLFNTNKHDTGNKLDAMKPIKEDKDNPFGATIRQVTDPSTGKLSSVMNIVGSKPGMGEEGGWEEWSKTLSSQFLSKQSPSLAKSQLDMAYEHKKSEFDEIMSLTNPTVRRKLLEEFADSADSSAVHLQAAHLPRQANKVLLPVNSMKPTEVYAPSFRNGERVVLVRHPHGGTFEIPELVVNNRNKEAKQLLGNATDAIGIHHKVAERLSGADFDGDTVLVIPNNQGRIKTTPALADLKDFDAKTSYPPYDGMRTIDGGVYNATTKKVEFAEGKRSSGATKQHQMGVVSNLITDMTIQKASTTEIARAVRHSMVVIDAEKHTLDWKRSARENGIRQLQQKYQVKPDGTYGGASTLISKAGSRIDVPYRKPRSAAKGGPIDRITGEKRYEPTGEMKLDRRTGMMVPRTFISKKLAETSDAGLLSSGTLIEKIYADHSNRLKSLANEARRESVNITPRPQSTSAKLHYAEEVKTLNSKLNLALQNRPLERQAQIIANSTVRMKKRDNPNMDTETRKKIEFQALSEARRRVDAKALRIDITDREWEAIQAGAISNHKLKQILDKADPERVRQLATPRTALKMTPTKQARAEQMLASGYTQAEVADALGVGLSTLKASIGGG